MAHKGMNKKIASQTLDNLVLIPVNTNYYHHLEMYELYR